MTTLACWMSHPHFPHAEIARDVGLDAVVLDIEHGTFDLGTLHRFVGLLQALGMAAHAKVLGPTPEAIQQALDFGCASVIIPHIAGVEHARQVCAAAKYPPLGQRSYAAGRSMAYRRAPDGFLTAENRRVRCWPMCETAGALAEIEAILALDSVDGVFMGPSDLALSEGRPDYAFTEDDRADLARVARACQTAGKGWVMPGWTAAERAFVRGLDPPPEMMVVGADHGIIRAGFDGLLAELRAEGLAGQG